jgi:apolipoprotein N-acyltransferase
MTARRLLATYVLLNLAFYLYSAIRYGVPFDALSWVCMGVSLLILVLLVRGSRGAWLLSFLGATFAVAYGAGVLMDEDGLTVEWLFIFVVYVLQLRILTSAEVREYTRRTAYERAIKAHRSW